ncbi:carboxypeptidase-like regulatory domain-containing protein [Flavobacterium sp. H122]|uniref:carboxypeptidase-like regulatory domain-containing protein n=1 Tax=Flavobacterium sp. H122 TaxID=2529860 RepID=UPI0010A9E49A|nr:carboxypeptidase-like regulatory domain-containing protein [Flavobacterium sp. H122]
MKKLQLSIPESCHENWNKMTPVEKGRFCDACQKKVHDFTKSTDKEIIKAYESGQKLCGRFLNTQLDRELVIPKEKKSIWLATVFFGIISLTNNKMLSQEKPKTAQTDVKEEIQGEIVYIPHNNEQKEISGIVKDTFGKTLPGVYIIINDSIFRTKTDLGGKFLIKVKQGDQLLFDYGGFETQNLKILNFKNLEIILKKENLNCETKEFTLGGAVATGVKIKKRNFLGRTFQKIGNWFR